MTDQLLPNEAEASRALVARAQEIDALVRDLAAPWSPPEPGSRLAGDNAATDPYHLSHAATRALSVALDNLHGFRELTLRPGSSSDLEITTRPWTAFPSLRAAYENSCLALSLAGGPSRRERVRRLLRDEKSNGKNLERFLAVADEHKRLAYDPAKRASALAAIADAYAIPSTDFRWTGYGDIAEEAGESLAFGPRQSRAHWQMLSGLTHGDPWTTVSLRPMEEVGRTADEVVQLRVTTQIPFLDVTSGLVLATFRRALTEFASARTNHVRAHFDS